jgi:hypothetical protein
MKVLPPDVPQYSTKPAGGPGVPQLTGGGARVIICGPGGFGKTCILCNLLTRTEAYRGAFEKIYVFSPSVNLDKNWDVVKRYQTNGLKAGPREQLYYPDFSEEALQALIDRQEKITMMQKDRGMRKLYAICIVLDDIADRVDIARNSRALQTLFVRGRHFCITTIVSVQKYRVLSNLIRINATDLLIGHIRNQADLDALAEETSALVPQGKKGFLELYHYATKERYSFLNCKLSDPDKSNTFWLRFDHPIHLEEIDDKEEK